MYSICSYHEMKGSGICGILCTLTLIGLLESEIPNSLIAQIWSQILLDFSQGVLEVGKKRPGVNSCSNYWRDIMIQNTLKCLTVTISIFGSTSIPFPLYFAIHFAILFKSSFIISITKLFYFQPFYYSAFYYSAFYYSASLSLSIIQPSIIQLYYSATFLLL